MTTTKRYTYLYTISDVPGVAGPWNFLSVFNPAGSGVTHIALSVLVASYADGGTSATQSMTGWRTTAHSGGSLVSPPTVSRHQTNFEDPVSEVRVSGPVTVPAVGVIPVVSAFPPVIASGQGASNTISTTPPGVTFIVLPGEGLAFGTVSGDTNQFWSITYVWQEIT